MILQQDEFSDSSANLVIKRGAIVSRNVLILSASIGTGHIRAAQSLLKSFQSIDPGAKVRHEDALDFVNPAFAKFYRRAYSDLANNAPEIMGLLIDGSEKNWPPTQHGIAFERWNSQPLIKAVEKNAPDLVICTHPLPADMISWLICRKRLWAQHGIVITDFELNPMWLCQHYSRYFVAIEEARQYLIQIGYDAASVLVSGIPVDPVFQENKDKADMKRKYGLDPEAHVLLLSAGGLGMGPVQDIVRSLMQVQAKCQVIALCGKNMELKESLTNYKEQNSISDYALKIRGFSNDMDEYMSAADLIVGKPGGLTSSESLAKGLVFVIVQPIPGQEERNADHLLEEGAAIRCNNLETIPYKVNRLLSDPLRLIKMQECALNFSRPQAANIISEDALGKNGFETWRSLVHPRNHNCDLLLHVT